MMAPTAVGVMMNWSLFWSAVLLAIWNFGSAFVEYSLLRSIYMTVPKLKVEKPQTINSTKMIDFSAFKVYWNSFVWPGLSFSLLFLTVLGFDSITIGYASEMGVDEIVSRLSKDMTNTFIEQCKLVFNTSYEFPTNYLFHFQPLCFIRVFVYHGIFMCKQFRSMTNQNFPFRH